MSAAPHILFICGLRDWAYEFKADAISGRLGNTFQFTKHFTEDSFTLETQGIDAAYLFYWHDVPHLKGVEDIPLAGGITSHRHLESTSDEEIQDKIGRFKVFTANSLPLFEWASQYRKDVIYAPNGVDIEQFIPAEDSPSVFRVGWVGNPKDGLKLFQQVIEPLRKMHPDIEFSFAFQQERLPHEKMKEFYQKCSCLLVASHFEGTPNPALEAGACGIPVIANEVGNMPELIVDGVNGFLVNPKVEEYVERIRLLQNSPKLREKMGREMRKAIEKDWSWDVRVKPYEEVFRSLCG